MVIDDDERTVNTLTAVLNAKGHTVLGVRIHETGCYVLERGHKKPCSLQAAKTYIADNNISVDVIFLDHLMIIGVFDGTDAARELALSKEKLVGTSEAHQPYCHTSILYSKHQLLNGEPLAVADFLELAG